MFDVGFWEMAFIGVIALIVIGPEKLPGVARTLGAWMGKGRRMINDVKTDIKKEMREEDLKGFRDLKSEITSAGTNLKNMAKDVSDKTGLAEAGKEIKESVGGVGKKIREEVEILNENTGNSGKTAAKKTTGKKATVRKKTAAKKSTGKKSPGKKTAAAKKTKARTASTKAVPGKVTASKKAAGKKTTARKTAGKAGAKKTAVGKSPSKKVSGKAPSKLSADSDKS